MNLYTVKDVAKMAQVHIMTVYAAINSGSLPARRLTKRKIRVTQEDLEEWLAKTKSTP